MKTLKVYGALRKLLGQDSFEFVADTPVQALKALLVNFPELNQWFARSEERGVAYKVMVGKESVHDEDISELFLPWSERNVFSITPVVTGAGGNVGQILGGVALVAAAIVLGPAAGGFMGLGMGLSGGGMGIIGGVAATAMGMVGAALIVNGVSNMISPVPTPNGLVERDQSTRLESNSFSGIVNTIRQGAPVPIAYGRVFVGSAVISASIDTDQR